VFWEFQAFHAFRFVFVPIDNIGFSRWLWLLFSPVSQGWVSIVFQLAILSNHPAFLSPMWRTGKLEDEGAVHQIKTTANSYNNP